MKSDKKNSPAAAPVPAQPNPADTRLVRYWRRSLADSVLGTGRINQFPPKGAMSLSTSDLMSGHVSNKVLDALFDKQDKSLSHVQVWLWPLIVSRRTDHATRPTDGLPHHVAPIVSAAIVSREDRAIRPVRTMIPRDLLQPLPHDEFSLGTVECLDTFLTTTPILPVTLDQPHDDAWRRYREDCARLRAAVAGDWPESDPRYERAATGLIQPARDTSPVIRHTLELYETLLRTRPDTPLLTSYCRGELRPLSKSLRPPHALAAHLGHSTNAFSLTDKQRDVLAHLATSNNGDILAVNGPPGTGKTTMLLSAIASEWVRAAEAGEDPPIIAAASSNNQAVTNIIDAFQKDFAAGEGPFAGRWLPDINSFGFYLPAHRLETQAALNYQTTYFFQNRETETYVRHAETAYKRAAKAALPDLEQHDIPAVVSALHDRITATIRILREFDDARATLTATRSEVEREIGPDPEAAITRLNKHHVQRVRQHADNRHLLSAWQSYIADEPLLLGIFSFLPTVSRKRRARAARFLEDTGYPNALEPTFRIAAIEPDLRQRLTASQQLLQEAEARLARGLAARSRLSDANTALASAAQAISPDADDLDHHASIQRIADCGMRFHLFLLATHYWEGRWLLEMHRFLPHAQADNTKSGNPKTGKARVIPRWRRRMMLTPCMVSTFAMLPQHMTYSVYEDGYRTRFLWNFIDLLIVDEAGQATPETGGPAFALAKRAIVIGDTRQIEPISDIPKPVDIGNLIEHDLLPTDPTQAQLDHLSDLGVRSTTGSVMRVAQAACRYHAEPSLDRGLYLFEHRRSYDEIVAYCNALCYAGKLTPLRGPAPSRTPDFTAAIPGPMAYLHVDGLCTASSGSRANPLESRTIAAWLDQHRQLLETTYSSKLEHIVGIVTPFARQAHLIRQACLARKIPVGGRGGITIGTVHALQGADRDIVIFSPTYSKHSDGAFIDMSPSMLNVAVSRAKDAFIVIGDMDLFSIATPGSPRGTLAEFLFSRPSNAIPFEVQPRDDLARHQHRLETLRDAAEHDAFLLKLLDDPDLRKLAIVSPWIRLPTMKRTGILPALAAARRRGADIDVYVDPHLNDSSHMHTARASLLAAGIRMHSVRQLHSKIITADDNLLSVGSFNWLSADRRGQFARHETSLVYRGSHLSDEIDAITGSLHQRTIAPPDLPDT